MTIMKNNIYKIAACIFITALMSGCTKDFENYNTNPFGPTEEQMKADNALTGSLIKAIIPTLVQGQQNNSQMIDQMVGSEYGGHISCIASWGNAGNFYTYNPRIGWYDIPFDTMMSQIYTSYFQILEYTQGKGPIFYWAQIIRIATTLKISDCYGPVPYSNVGGGAYTVAYDSMEDLYDNMFADLDEAITALESLVLSGEDMSSLAESDYIYNGDFTKWVKFANTLKLRMAIRISSVKPELAQAKAEEAVNDVIGVMSSASDAAWSSYNDGMNPYKRAAYDWNGGELRVSANITSYLGGYNDPRLEKYATEVNGEYRGVRNGIEQSAATTTAYQAFSNVNISEDEPLLVMSASEAYFLRAEGALKGWSMGDSAKDLYEEGVSVSMSERGVSIGSYLSSTATPADYTDTYNSSNNIAAVTTVCPAYDETAGDEVNLERILVQKWIASFPNGWERWADFRRTGYPRQFPVVKNSNSDGVTSARGMRRLPYPSNEYNTNAANVADAVNMLGGADNAATDLWWAKKN
ncbi:MAG: SusD/RagB family nutrient-binding outer membrane lipoprotein [Bacteroidales bacterium]|nr:SusD/RagB family nutrient-binding outer membrane lipoprotein [Bacteroidales bacterium]MDE7128623.1 SusD/RagB family nutrient-binding outer membrane lipoprotein [Bacteroidales bacterium]